MVLHILLLLCRKEKGIKWRGKSKILIDKIYWCECCGNVQRPCSRKSSFADNCSIFIGELFQTLSWKNQKLKLKHELPKQVNVEKRNVRMDRLIILLLNCIEDHYYFVVFILVICFPPPTPSSVSCFECRHTVVQWDVNPAHASSTCPIAFLHRFTQN